MAKSKKSRSTQGSIDSRGIGGQYRARIRINGATLTQTFQTCVQARAWLDDICAKHRRPDRRQRAVAAASLTLGEALEKRLDHITENKNHRNEGYAVRRILRDFPDLTGRPIYDVDEIDIKEFIEARSVQVAAATVNRDLCILSHTFNLARSQFECTHLRNPIGPTTRLRVPSGRVRRLSLEEEVALLAQAAIYELTSTVPIGPIIRFACDTAMRCGEIAGLRWERVDLDRGTVYLPDTKNGDARSVPLWLEVRALLRDLGPKQEGPVWGAYEAIRSAWRRVKAAAVVAAEARGNKKLANSLSDLRFHDLRHEGTSRLIERTGWENSKIQAVTGHKTAAMLARYTHLRSADLASQMASLEGGGASLRVIRDQGITLDQDVPDSLQKRAAWRAVSQSKELLSALVSARPVSKIAVEFGVSDVAVHKACSRLEVEKPVRGFWLRTENAAAEAA